MASTKVTPIPQTRKGSRLSPRARQQARENTKKERAAAAAGLEQRRAKTIAELQRMTLRQLREEAYFQQFEQNHKTPGFYAWPPMEPWKYIAKGFDPEPKSERERAILAICQRLVREERSFDTTPVHSFVCAVLERMHTDQPSVANVKKYVEQMETGWEAVVAAFRASKRRQKKYEEEYGFWQLPRDTEEESDDAEADE